MWCSTQTMLSFLIGISTIHNCAGQYQPTPLKSATLSPLNNNVNGASVSVLNADVTTSNVWSITTSTQEGWNLLLSLDNTWGFYPNDESSLQISINGYSPNSALDLILSFSVNNADFFSIFLSMDNDVNNRISPNCDIYDIQADPSSNNKNSGNVNQIMSADNGNNRWYKASLNDIWGGMRQGQKIQGYDNDWPLQFTLTNTPNTYGDDLFVSFTTPTWNTWSQNCGFNSFASELGLQMYIGSNNNGEQFVITSISIEYEYQLTYPPTTNPTDISVTTSPSANTVPQTATQSPTKYPITAPSKPPTNDPTDNPSFTPTSSSKNPTQSPTRYPSTSPSKYPTKSPVTSSPSTLLSTASSTTQKPTDIPTKIPSNEYEDDINTSDTGDLNMNNSEDSLINKIDFEGQIIILIILLIVLVCCAVTIIIIIRKNRAETKASPNNTSANVEKKQSVFSMTRNQLKNMSQTASVQHVQRPKLEPHSSSNSFHKIKLTLNKIAVNSNSYHGNNFNAMNNNLINDMDVDVIDIKPKKQTELTAIITPSGTSPISLEDNDQKYNKIKVNALHAGEISIAIDNTENIMQHIRNHNKKSTNLSVYKMEGIGSGVNNNNENIEEEKEEQYIVKPSHLQTTKGYIENIDNIEHKYDEQKEDIYIAKPKHLQTNKGNIEKDNFDNHEPVAKPMHLKTTKGNDYSDNIDNKSVIVAYPKPYKGNGKNDNDIIARPTNTGGSI